MKTCPCGGMIMEDWTVCRFCGRPVGAADEPPAPPTFSPLGPSEWPAPEAPKSGPAIPIWAIVLGVVVVIGLMASFFLGGDDDGAADEEVAAGASEAPSNTRDPEVQFRRAIDRFCDGDRSGLPAARPFDRAPGRIHPVTGLGFYEVSPPEGWSPKDLEEIDQVELALCRDLVPGTEVDGNRCDGYSTGVVRQNVDAQWNLRLYAVQNGELLAETTVTSSGNGCPMNIHYDPDSIDAGMVREVRTPRWSDVEAFVAPFVAP